MKSLCVWLYPRAQPVRVAIAMRTTHGFLVYIFCARGYVTRTYTLYKTTSRHLVSLKVANGSILQHIGTIPGRLGSAWFGSVNM